MVDQGHFERVLAGTVGMPAPFDWSSGVVVRGAFHCQDRASALLVEQRALLRGPCPRADSLLGDANVDTLGAHELIKPPTLQVHFTQLDQFFGEKIFHDRQGFTVPESKTPQVEYFTARRYS